MANTMIPGKMRLAAALLMLGALVACQSAEERAQKHFQSAVELIEAGDPDRALVELRNALQANERHREARLMLATTLLGKGDIGRAYGQLQKFVEYFPDDAEGRVMLAHLAATLRDWPVAERHLQAARDARPDDVRVRIVETALAYRDALQARDAAAEAQAVEAARALVAEAPDDLLPRQILIDGLVRARRLEEALAEIDGALRLAPEDEALNRLRLAVLNDLGRTEEVEAQLRAMVERDPDEPAHRRLLLQWFLSRGETDKAEAFLRQLAETGGDPARTDLVTFLARVRGPEATIAELDRLIAEGGNTDYWRALRAGLKFDLGQREEALAELEEIAAAAEPSEQTRTIKTTLARLRWATGNRVGARELIEEVLAEDPAHVEAMKLKAGWLIGDDRTDEAIRLLRAALEQAPQDPQILTLMAQAYERSGARDLMAEMLARAVEVSGKAPAESLRYARLLLSEGKELPAEQVLIEALRQAPRNLELLRALGEVYLRLEDWPRLTQVIDTLGRMEDNPVAQGIHKDLRLAMLRAQGRNEDALAFLESLATGEGEEDARARLGIVRAHLQDNDLEKARAALDEALARYPESLVFRALDARLKELEGDREAAVEIYRSLLAENPRTEALWRELYAVLQRAGREEEARAVLDEALAAVPGPAATLKWMKASELERAGRYDEAIAIYEELYALNSDNLIIANNLASMLASYRKDPESLERAHAVARRLRGSEQPYFRDTWGWIAYLRGDYQDALEHLEPAAASGVPEPVIHYHLGMTYLALGQPEKARAALARAVEMAGPSNTSPEIEAARRELARLAASEGGAQAGSSDAAPDAPAQQETGQ